MNVSVLKEKKTTHWCSYFESTKTNLWLTCYIFICDNLCILLLGYRIEFSCLYISQGHTFVSTVWLWNIDKYVFFFQFERKSTFKNSRKCPLHWFDIITPFNDVHYSHQPVCIVLYHTEFRLILFSICFAEFYKHTETN